MCLQLFQLTCKCGHLHLRRKRKGEIEGGRKKRERRGTTANASTKPGPRAVGVTLLLVTRQAHIQNQKSYQRIKDLFSPRPTEKKKKKRIRKIFSTAFFLEQAVFHLWGYYLLHCRFVQWAGFPYNFSLSFLLFNTSSQTHLVLLKKKNSGHCNRFIPASDSLKWIRRAQRLRYQTRPKFSDSKSQIFLRTAASVLPLDSRGWGVLRTCK